MQRLLVFVYGLASYAVGMGGLFFFILFVGGWEFLPFHIDSGVPGPLWKALLINASLMVMLGLQHSVMARPGFKRAWCKLIPRAAERSTYVLLSGIVFVLICIFWQPIAGTVWEMSGQIAATIATAIQLFGWGLVVASSFAINHFELFGLRQVWCYFAGRSEPAPYFTDRLLYKIVRHPLQLGVLIGLWCTSVMSMTHLMLSVLMTLYIFIGLYFEERDLVASLGEDYKKYQKRVPMILPIPKRNRKVE